MGAWLSRLAASPPLPRRLEPEPGVAQCNYEARAPRPHAAQSHPERTTLRAARAQLLRAFNGWMDENGLQYTLGAGTLLGAMRNEPPGLLQWEHDVDVYVLARQASLLLRKLQACPPPTPYTWSALLRTSANPHAAQRGTRSTTSRGPLAARTTPQALRCARQADCSPTSPAAWRSRYCSTLLLEGSVDREGRPCCGT